VVGDGRRLSCGRRRQGKAGAVDKVMEALLVEKGTKKAPSFAQNLVRGLRPVLRKVVGVCELGDAVVWSHYPRAGVGGGR
jgi:hypothetical protein